jgi:hypothetical protein
MDPRRDGDGQDPDPEDGFCQTPANCAQTLEAADAHDSMLYHSLSKLREPELTHES